MQVWEHGAWCGALIVHAAPKQIGCFALLLPSHPSAARSPLAANRLRLACRRPLPFTCQQTNCPPSVTVHSSPAAYRRLPSPPLLALQFTCQQINCTRDTFGNVVDGKPDEVHRVYYFW